MKRLYASYSNSTSQTTSQAGESTPFKVPSTGFQIHRSNCFTIGDNGSGGVQIVVVDPSETTFWCTIDATCNVIKPAGYAGTTQATVVWRLNGVEVGSSRTFDVVEHATVISGSGELQLKNGDVLTPCIATDSSPLILQSCSFRIVEDNT